MKLEALRDGCTAAVVRTVAAVGRWNSSVVAVVVAVAVVADSFGGVGTAVESILGRRCGDTALGDLGVGSRIGWLVGRERQVAVGKELEVRRCCSAVASAGGSHCTESRPGSRHYPAMGSGSHCCEREANSCAEAVDRYFRSCQNRLDLCHRPVLPGLCHDPHVLFHGRLCFGFCARLGYCFR